MISVILIPRSATSQLSLVPVIGAYYSYLDKCTYTHNHTYNLDPGHYLHLHTCSPTETNLPVVTLTPGVVSTSQHCCASGHTGDVSHSIIAWGCIHTLFHLQSVWPQATTWTNARLLSIEPLETNFSEIQIKISNFSLMKMHLKMSSAKWWPFCPGGNELKSDWKTRNKLLNQYVHVN